MTSTAAKYVCEPFIAQTSPSQVAGSQLELQQASWPDAHRCRPLRTRHQSSRERPAGRGLKGCQARLARCCPSRRGRQPQFSATCCGGHAAVESAAEAFMPAIVCIMEDAREPLVSFRDLHAVVELLLGPDTLSLAWGCTAC